MSTKVAWLVFAIAICACVALPKVSDASTSDVLSSLSDTKDPGNITTSDQDSAMHRAVDMMNDNSSNAYDDDMALKMNKVPSPSEVPVPSPSPIQSSHVETTSKTKLITEDTVTNETIVVSPTALDAGVSNSTSNETVTKETSAISTGSMERGATVDDSAEDPKNKTTVGMNSARPAYMTPIGHKDVLIAVVTAPNHFGGREAIRRTYARAADDSGRADVLFFVGMISDENPEKENIERQLANETGIIRLYDFTESYHNLSSKALGIFKYGSEHGYKTVFKVDDDTYVRVGLLLSFLDDYCQDPYVYAGDFVNGKHATVLDPKSKWYMYDQYPHPLEDYVNGVGILLGKAPLKFLKTNFDDLTRFRVDDAGLAIWLKNMPLEHQKMYVDHYSYVVHPDTIYVNPVNAHEMDAVHAGVSTTLQICKETCLCWGGPLPTNVPHCLTWDEFRYSDYKDLVDRTL